MSISVVTVAYGPKYRAHLTKWADSINRLERQPDEVIIATDDVSDAVARTINLTTHLRVLKAPPTHKRHPQIHANEAIRKAETEWICRLDVDDRIYPHAFNTVDACQTDVLCFGISVNGERNLYPSHVTAETLLNSPHNLLFAGSPYRKSAWEKTPGYQDILYDDWRLWRDLAAAGATFTPTGTIDYKYSWSPESSTYGIDHQTEREHVFTPLH